MTHAGALWLEMVALPILIIDVTGSAIHLGMVMFVRTLPAVFFGMVAGVLADRFNRRLVLLMTKLTVLSISVTFFSVVITNNVLLWHIYGYTLLRGIMMAFDQPAQRALIPATVPPHLTTNAMALSMGSVQVMRIGGAAAAGLLIAAFGMASAFGGVVLMYIGAVTATYLLRVPDHARAQGDGAFGVRNVASNLWEGLRYAWANPTIRGILIITISYFAFGQSFMQVFAPLFAKQVLGTGDEGVGYMLALTGVGGVIGALVIATTNPRKSRGIIVLASMAIQGAVLTALSLTTYTGILLLVYGVAVIVGLAQAAIMPLTNAVMLDNAPEQMRGRIMGLLSLDRAMAAGGAAMAGFMAAALGTQLAQIAFGLGCIATAAVLAITAPSLRKIK